jgi:universal stress protein A
MKTETKNPQRPGKAATRNAQHSTTTAERPAVAHGKVFAMKRQIQSDGVTKLRKSIYEEADGQKPIRIKKKLAPTDFSPASKKAFSYALRLAQEQGSKITLLHVLEPESPLTLAGRPAAAALSKEELADTEESLRALADEAAGAGVAGAKSIVRTGVATYEIIEAAKELHIDLIVIATHGFTGWKHFAIGSTAERVARAAPCPVLVVREKEHDFT